MTVNGFNRIVDAAGRCMEDRDFDAALKVYRFALDYSISELNGDMPERYKTELLPSLQLLGERDKLKEELMLAEKQVSEAEEEYNGTEGCGSEHTAAYYSLTGLKWSGYPGVQRRRLAHYESKLLDEWHRLFVFS